MRNRRTTCSHSACGMPLVSRSILTGKIGKQSRAPTPRTQEMLVGAERCQPDAGYGLAEGKLVFSASLETESARSVATEATVTRAPALRIYQSPEMSLGKPMPPLMGYACPFDIIMPITEHLGSFANSFGPGRLGSI